MPILMEKISGNFLTLFLYNWVKILRSFNGTYPLRGSSVKLDPIRAIGLDGSIDLPA